MAGLMLAMACLLGLSALQNRVGGSVHAQGLPPSFAAVAKQVQGAVVNINTEQTVQGGQDPFSRFFGFGGDEGSRTQRSLGSGFVVDPAGLVLTNNHVVEHATRIRVRINSGRQMDATVVGTDPQTDLAVLRVKTSDSLPALKLAAADDTQVGDWVLAFGSPFGLEHTMTAGIISAKGRVIGAGPYDNFLQTDAAINPGNSGGPLVNLRGEAVGINTIIYSQSGGFEGVGFAIPAVLAQGIYHQLVTSGKVTRGWLGVSTQELTPELAKAFSVPAGRGVVVAQVEPGSPAASAGLRTGDILLEYNGQPVNSMRDLSLAVAATRAGTPSKLTVLRQGQQVALSVRVGERPQVAEERDRELPRAAGTGEQQPGKLGVSIANVTPDVAQELGLSSNEGALITEVRPGGPAENAGLRPGDVIREMNRTAVRSAADVSAGMRNARGGSTVLLRVERQGSALYVAVEVP
jgi:serine protease Do